MVDIYDVLRTMREEMVRSRREPLLISIVSLNERTKKSEDELCRALQVLVNENKIRLRRGINHTLIEFVEDIRKNSRKS